MMRALSNLLRLVRVRGLREGLVQSGRVEGYDPDAREDAQRHQDYGFTGMPVDGEGLKIEVGGHTIILRVDRLAERPHLNAYEVCVWHKEGHKVTLKAGGQIVADCTEFIVNASSRVVLNTPSVQGPGDVRFAGTVTGDTDVVFAGKSSVGHEHGNVSNGGGHTSAPI